jgi:AcrR family transcriptional regulator
VAGVDAPELDVPELDVPELDVAELDVPEAGLPEGGVPGAGLQVEMARGGRPRDDAREQAILDAAIDLVAEIGYDAMSIEAVAARAKSSKATIYRRWPGKAELVAEAMRRRSEPVFELPDTGSLRGDLLALVQRMFDSINGVDGGLLCGLAVAVRNDAQFGRLVASHLHEQKLRPIAAIVARAEARGELPPGVDPALVLQVAPGVALFQQISGETLDAAFAEHLVDRVLIHLLRP